jgi:hypothetical protein
MQADAGGSEIFRHYVANSSTSLSAYPARLATMLGMTWIELRDFSLVGAGFLLLVLGVLWRMKKGGLLRYRMAINLVFVGFILAIWLVDTWIKR